MKMHLIWNSDLGNVAEFTAKKSNAKLKNWSRPIPTNDEEIHKGYFTTVNEGRYSRGCKYTRYSYNPKYISYVIINDDNSNLTYYYGFKNEIKSKVVNAPKGMIFNLDSEGLSVVRLTDKMDYHLSCSDLLSPKFATTIRETLAFNYNRRLKLNKRKKEHLLHEKLFNKDLKNTMVTLQDSRNAGNCLEGTFAFIKNNFNISRENVLNNTFFFKISADKLIKTNNEKALAAAKIAWQRETLIQI